MGRWSLPLASISIGGDEYYVGSDTTALMDTGASFALLPGSILDKLANSIKGASQQALSPIPGPYDYAWQVPCDSNGPSLSFKMKNGGSLALGSIDYILPLDNSSTCIIGFMPISDNSGIGNALLLGNTFLKKFYTVFDFDNRRIGFTVAKGRTGSTFRAKSGATLHTTVPFYFSIFMMISYFL
jgi:hypothetical protein